MNADCLRASRPHRALHVLIASIAMSAAFGNVTLAASGAATAEARVEQALGELKTLESRFEQTLSGKHGEVLERASGTLYIQKPDRFRWVYETGVRQLIVSDGTRLWLYDQELDQVTVRALGQALAATPAALLSGTGHAAMSFRITDLGSYESLDCGLDLSVGKSHNS